jgi:hypothetical protein
MAALTDRDIDILSSLRENLSANDRDLLDKSINNTLDMIEVQRVCEIINDEYLMKGIEANYSPNDYGKELEAILNKINAIRLL